MIHIDFVSAVPDILCSPLQCSILERAQRKGILKVEIHALRNYSPYKHRKIDDYPYGGGGGMVLQVEPIDRCITSLKAKRSYTSIIGMSPSGEHFTQKIATELSQAKSLLFLCGHYSGIDERVRKLGLLDREISVGNYVLTGGELAALVVCDALVRLIPGVLGEGKSALEDSFQNHQLAAPLYTRPASYKGLEVPSVLRSGHSQEVAQWREQAAQTRTAKYRPKLLRLPFTETKRKA